MMNKLLGSLLILIGLGLGLYVGVYICFIGGIIDIVDFVKLMIKKDIVEAGLLAWGIVKMMFAGFVGYVSGMFPFAAGVYLFKK